MNSKEQSILHSVLLVIDMQNDFINGSLGTKEAQDIVTNVMTRIICHSRLNHGDIIYTMDYHDMSETDYVEFNTIPAHCINYTPGAEINSDIKDALELADRNNKDIEIRCIKKHTFGTFSWDEHKDIIECYDTIEIIGLCTDICVINNALILRNMFPKHKIVVHADSCAGSTPENHQKALDIMKANLIEIQ